MFADIQELHGFYICHATSSCLNLVSTPTIGLVKSGMLMSSWFIDFPANWAMQSNATLIFFGLRGWYTPQGVI